MTKKTSNILLSLGVIVSILIAIFIPQLIEKHLEKNAPVIIPDNQSSLNFGEMDMSSISYNNQVKALSIKDKGIEIFSITEDGYIFLHGQVIGRSPETAQVLETIYHN